MNEDNTNINGQNIENTNSNLVPNNNNQNMMQNPVTNNMPSESSSAITTEQIANQTIMQDNAVSNENNSIPQSNISAEQSTAPNQTVMQNTTSNAVSSESNSIPQSNAPVEQPTALNQTVMQNTTSNAVSSESNSIPQSNAPVEQPTESNAIKTVEFVNPINPTQVVKTKTLEVPKTVIVKPEPNQPILATTPIIPNQEIQANSPAPIQKPKKKSNLLIIIVAIIMLLVIGAVVYFTFFNKKTPTKPTTPVTPPVEEQPVVPKTSLLDVESKLKENSDFQKLEITTSIQNNQLLFKALINNQEMIYTYELKENLLNTTFSNEDLTAMMIFSYVADAIGQCNGNEKGDVIAYFNSVGILQSKIDGLTITTKENNYEISLNIDTKFDTSSLKTMYFQIEDFKPIEDILINTGSYQSAKGYLLFYKAGDAAKTTIILAEKKQLSELTYKSILSVIELLYNDELESFKTAYPQITTSTFGRYTITTDPTLTGIIKTLYSEYQEDYKFIEIIIDKTIE